LASDTFKYLRRLKELHLSNNRIRTIAAVSGSFEHLDILDTLSLSGNLLQNLPDNSFSEISSLRNLDLSHCPLKTLSEKAFSGLRSFDKLTLSHTKLTEFPTTAAYQLRPRELDISHNQIYHINQEALNTVQRMDKSVL
jgi:platelet glycoprotein-5